MAFVRRMLSLLAPVVCLALAGCPGDDSGGTSSTSTSTTGGGGGTWGETGFETGLDTGGASGGALEDCFSYADACLQDPYCYCYLECVSSELSPSSCLAKCQLAQVPYWAQQFEACIGGELQPEPDPPDTGDDTGPGTSGTTGQGTTGPGTDPDPDTGTENG